MPAYNPNMQRWARSKGVALKPGRGAEGRA